MGPILIQKPPPKPKNFLEASNDSELKTESSGEHNEDNSNNRGALSGPAISYWSGVPFSGGAPFPITFIVSCALTSFLLDFLNIIFVFTVATHRMFKNSNAIKFRMGNADLILAVPLDRGRL